MKAVQALPAPPDYTPARGRPGVHNSVVVVLAAVAPHTLLIIGRRPSPGGRNHDPGDEENTLDVVCQRARYGFHGSALFPEAELAEDAIQEVFRGGFAGDPLEPLGGPAEVVCEQLKRHF